MSSVRRVDSQRARNAVVSGARARAGAGSRTSIVALLVLLLVVASGCGADSAEPPETTSSGPGVPESLEGVWVLEGTTLFLDIRLATATVDGRTDCARILGSLTADADGDPTSFSLPGSDTSGCTISQRRTAEGLVDMLESVASAEAQPGGYVLRDESGSELGQLLSG